MLNEFKDKQSHELDVFTEEFEDKMANLEDEEILSDEYKSEVTGEKKEKEVTNDCATPHRTSSDTDCRTNTLKMSLNSGLTWRQRWKEREP